MSISKMTAIFIIVLILSISIYAEASTLKKMNLSELTLSADLIVRAELMSVYEAFEVRTARLHEYSVLEVKESIKGDAPSTVTVRQVARVMNAAFATIVSGQTVLEKGQEYLLFLRKKGEMHFIVGMVQGHYQLLDNAGKLIAVQKFQGVSLVETYDGGKNARIENNAIERSIEYSKLKQEIIDILKAAEDYDK